MLSVDLFVIGRISEKGGGIFRLLLIVLKIIKD